MKKYFYKKWFVFPFCITIEPCLYRMDYKTEIQFHILWWHFRWYIRRTGYEK